MKKFTEYIETELAPESEFWDEETEGNPETKSWAQDVIAQWSARYSRRKEFLPDQLDDIADAISDFLSGQPQLSGRQKMRFSTYLAWVLQEKFYDGMEPGESDF